MCANLTASRTLPVEESDVPVTLDTRDVPVDERFELWASESRRIFEPMEVSSPLAADFLGRTRGDPLGPLVIHRLAADRSTVRRTRRMIADSDREWLQLALSVRGCCRVTQDGRSMELKPGTLTTWQSSTPYSVDAVTPFGLVVAFVPRALLGAHADRLYRATATPVAASVGRARLLRVMLVQIARGLQSGELSPGDADVAESLLRLLRGAPAAAPTDRPELLRAQVLAHIDTHLCDPDLSPETIARALYVSRSQLDRVFADEDLGVAAVIRHARLERCREDLADPQLADRTIYEVAARWGFVSAPHFTRTFRSAYGCTPSEHRAGVA
jgi:AraC-like DNA-binding protein